MGQMGVQPSRRPYGPKYGEKWRLLCWQALKFDLHDCRDWEFMLPTSDEHASAATTGVSAKHDSNSSFHNDVDVDDTDEVSSARKLIC